MVQNRNAIFIKKWAIPGLLVAYFRLFQANINILQQIYVKNVHPEYSVGIWTHDLLNMSLLPYPLDQGSHPWVDLHWAPQIVIKILLLRR